MICKKCQRPIKKRFVGKEMYWHEEKGVDHLAVPLKCGQCGSERVVMGDSTEGACCQACGSTDADE